MSARAASTPAAARPDDPRPSRVAALLVALALGCGSPSATGVPDGAAGATATPADDDTHTVAEPTAGAAHDVVPEARTSWVGLAPGASTDVVPRRGGLADTPRPPNILLVVVDDLGWADPAFMGHAHHATPRMDALAAEGVAFTRAYANAPNCAPSRASLLTGRTSPRHGVYTVGSAQRGKARERKLVPPENTRVLPERELTLAELLQPARYESAAMGKWHLGDDPTRQGFDLNVGGDAAGHPHDGYSVPWNNPHLPDGPEGVWLTERLGQEAASWIAARDGERPWLLYLSFYAVHTPLQAPREQVDAWRARGLSKRAATYAAMVAAVDAALGRVLDTLDARGLADDTLVVLTSDNGGHLGATSNAPLRDGKGTLYEGGLRVPLVVRWPGRVRAGARDDTPVQLVDLVPTLLAAAGQRPPARTLDGDDLLPLLAGEAPLRERALFFHFPAYLEGSVPAHGAWRTTPASAIVHGDLKSIRWWEDGRVETYDLAADPSETNPRPPDRVPQAHLQRVLDVWLDRTQAALPTELEPRYREPAGR